MTTAKNLTAFRLPDPPDREPDDMTSYRQLAATSIIAPLRHYLGGRETTLVTGEQYLCRVVTQSLAGSRYPDLLIAFDVDMDAYHSSNGYVINDQGKPPDFVLEIASLKTGREDVIGKRDDYAGFGIPEYWRFDETPNGAWHGARLAGDRLVNGVYQPIPIEHISPDGVYQPIPIEHISPDILQGYSQVLNLLLRWENGELRWHNPQTGQHIATFADAQARADLAEDLASRAAARAGQERAARLQAEDRAGRAEDRADRAEDRADQERAARLQAEARTRELEARLGDMGDQ